MNPQRKRRLRQVGMGFGALTLGVMGAFAGMRLHSPNRAVRVHPVEGLRAHNDLGTDGLLRIGSYNIAHGRGVADSNLAGGSWEERQKRLVAMARELERLDLDIVVLNEVDFDSSWSGRQNQARALARRIGYPYWVEQRNFDVQLLLGGWVFGNALLSRFEVVHSERIALPGYSRVETAIAGQKDGLRVDLQIGRRRLAVLAVHLSYRSEAVRVESVRQLMAVARSLKETGQVDDVILAGDFNSTLPGFPFAEKTREGENAMEVLAQEGGFALYPTRFGGRREWLSWHTRSPAVLIDWIALPQGWSFEEYQVVELELSDHLPVIATIRPGW